MTLPCVVLAGGLGTRMRPATQTVPKALIPVRGRPFADLQMAWLAAHGVRDVVYSIGYLGVMLRDQLGDGTRFGLRIDYVDEGDELRGTGGALRLAADVGRLPAEFLLLNGDSYLTVDVEDVERVWRGTGLPALMTVLRNQGRWDTSNVIYRDGRVLVYDKQDVGGHGAALEWIDYGLSILSRDLITERVTPGGRADVADLMHDLAAEGLLAGYEVSERFYEIGSPEGLRDLEEHLS